MRVLLAASAVAALLLAPWQSAFAAGGAGGADNFLQLLLRPAGWSAEWSGPGGSGLTDVVFEQREGGVYAKIKLISPFELDCENPASVDVVSVTFDGCRDPQVTLTYDPSDSGYPLRGRTPRGYVWKVKPK
jgi:hypothetical protein